MDPHETVALLLNRPFNISRCTPLMIFEGYLGSSWAFVGHPLGRVGAVLAHLGPFLAQLGPFWAHIGPVLAHLGPHVACLWPLLALLGPVFAHLGRSRGQGDGPNGLHWGGGGNRFYQFWTPKLGPKIDIFGVIFGVPFLVTGEEVPEASLCQFRLPFWSVF